VEGNVLDARCFPVLDVFLGGILIGREVSLLEIIGLFQYTVSFDKVISKLNQTG
jgi:hypothetical protein